MVAQAEGHGRAGSAPHTEAGPVRPSPLIRRGGKWKGEEPTHHHLVLPTTSTFDIPEGYTLFNGSERSTKQCSESQIK